MKAKLTPKQAKFATLYVELGSATEAYRKAYSWKRMKPETVHRKAIEVLQNGNVAARIKELQAKLEKKQILTKEEILNDLKEISTVTINDYVDKFDPKTEKITFKPMDQWTLAMQRACTGFKPGRNGIELTIYGIKYAYDRISKMVGYDAPIKTEVTDTTLADLLRKDS